MYSLYNLCISCIVMFMYIFKRFECIAITCTYCHSTSLPLYGFKAKSNQLYTLNHNYLIIKNIINQFFVIFNIEYERKFLTLYKYGLLLIL